jgi:hypothetical protein
VHYVDPTDTLRQSRSSVSLQTPHTNARTCALSPNSHHILAGGLELWLFAASSVDRCLALPPPLDFVTPCVIQPGNHDQQINIGRSLKLNPNWPAVVSPHFPIKHGQCPCVCSRLPIPSVQSNQAEVTVNSPFHDCVVVHRVRFAGVPVYDVFVPLTCRRTSVKGWGKEPRKQKLQKERARKRSWRVLFRH